ADPCSNTLIPTFLFPKKSFLHRKSRSCLYRHEDDIQSVFEQDPDKRNPDQHQQEALPKGEFMGLGQRTGDNHDGPDDQDRIEKQEEEIRQQEKKTIIDPESHFHLSFLPEKCLRL